MTIDYFGYQNDTRSINYNRCCEILQDVNVQYLVSFMTEVIALSSNNCRNDSNHYLEKRRKKRAMDAWCGRAVFALFNMKLIALHVEAPYPFLTGAYMRTRISALSECNSVAHMLDNVMY